MNTWMLIVALLGAMLGALLVWLPLKARLRDSQLSGDELRQRNREAETALNNERQRADRLSEEGIKLATRAERLVNIEAQLERTGNDLKDTQKSLSAAESTVTELQTSLKEQQRGTTDKTQLLKEMENRLEIVFPTIAQKILDEKVKRFNQQSERQLGDAIGPLNREINKLRDAAMLQTNAMRTLRDHTEQIGLDAVNLTRALKGDSGVQGAWGEVVLARVLELSGVQKKRGYIVQTTFKTEDGSRQRPDVTIRLPEGKDVVVDAKVSLTAYERFASASDDATRKAAMKEHVLSIKRHIDGLDKRDYSNIPDLRTLDFVLMFVPIEAAFIDAVREDDAIYGYALERNIIVVCPSTLLAALRTINHVWRGEDRRSNHEEIAREGGLLHDYFTLLIEGIQELGNNLANAQTSQRRLLQRFTEGGQGSILAKIKKLKDLGAKAKKSLDPKLLEEIGAEDQSIESAIRDTDRENDDGADDRAVEEPI